MLQKRFLVIVILCLFGACCQVEAKPGTKIGDVSINPKDGAKMVWIPAGEFDMGSTDAQIDKVVSDQAKDGSRFFKEAMEQISKYEKPQHKVYLDGYWMYKYEVTVAQYRKFCTQTDRKMPNAPKWGWIANHPMVNVTWQDAVDYAAWAEVSLPTEAQWEKAARGTDGRTWPWGNKWDEFKCNFGRRSPAQTKPVGSYPSGASPYGCLDMAGNAYEWCSDWWSDDYSNAESTNPTGPAEGYGGVNRGGSWDYNSPISLRCTSRSGPQREWRRDYNGFRCAKTP
jgi:iron(II)-dependent oxidoreductase